MDNKIKILKSVDGKSFEIEEKYLYISSFLKDLINDFPEQDEIPINQIKSKCLEKIVEYLEHYPKEAPKPIPHPLPSTDLKSILNEWDYQFINNMSFEDCCELMNGANFLGINELMNLIGAKIASLMMTGTVEEVREKFGIPCDLTEEELKEYEGFPL